MASGTLFGTCQRCDELVWEDEDWDYVGEGTSILEHTDCRHKGIKTLTLTGVVIAKVVKYGLMTLVIDIGEREENQN